MKKNGIIPKLNNNMTLLVSYYYQNRVFGKRKKNKKKGLFLFMPILSQMFFTFVGRHFMSFSFFSAWHRKSF
jgi:hypothetical protein